jgi:hypothetical protein
MQLTYLFWASDNPLWYYSNLNTPKPTHTASLYLQTLPSPRNNLHQTHMFDSTAHNPHSWHSFKLKSNAHIAQKLRGLRSLQLKSLMTLHKTCIADTLSNSNQMLTLHKNCKADIFSNSNQMLTSHKSCVAYVLSNSNHFMTLHKTCVAYVFSNSNHLMTLHKTCIAYILSNSKHLITCTKFAWLTLSQNSPAQINLNPSATIALPVWLILRLWRDVLAANACAILLQLCD